MREPKGHQSYRSANISAYLREKQSKVSAQSPRLSKYRRIEKLK